MLNRSMLVRAALAVALCVFLSPSRTIAQDKDLAEVEHYTLTMQKVNQYSSFLKDLQAYAKAHPSAQDGLKEAMETDAEKHENTSAIERRMNANPAVASLLVKNGWTSHEFVLFQAALLQAGLASAMKPANQPDAEYASKAHINPANLAFVREHKAELESLEQSSKSD